ncbi:hypothetical protein [Lysobacter sp. A3-1-A15]|uniref:hypothetical protein n=1 Tax=Novilysobacter viscosus TaxID=3098602 RepID=UPI002ED80097
MRPIHVPSRRARFRRPLLAAVLAPTFFLSGCTTAMTQPSDAGGSAGASSHQSLPFEWPLRFEKHNFQVMGYEVRDLKVHYADRWQRFRDDGVLQPSRASFGPNYQLNWGGGHGSIKNFPAPARVSWRSRDGDSLEATVDVGKIFADQLIRHRVPREQIPDHATFGPPTVILEVNDRTINVYMRSYVGTKELQIPGNPYSHGRDDVILAYTQTY